jgi:hypothetical protein
MSDALAPYRALEDKLIQVRWLNMGYESAEEDALLEEMDELWWNLSDEERDMIHGEPSRSLIRTTPPSEGCTDVVTPGLPLRVGKVA